MCRGRVVVAGAQRGRWRCGGGGAAAVDLVSLAQAEGGSETQCVVRAVLPTSIAHPCGWPRDPIGVPPPKVPSRLSFPPTSVTSLSCLCLLKPSPSFDSTGPLSRLIFLPFPQLTSSPSFIFAVLAQGHTVGTFWGPGFNPGEPAPPDVQPGLILPQEPLLTPRLESSGSGTWGCMTPCLGFPICEMRMTRMPLEVAVAWSNVCDAAGVVPGTQ